MRKTFIIMVVIMAGALAAGDALAQGNDEGFVKRMMRRFRKEAPQTQVEKAAPAVKPVEESVPEEWTPAPAGSRVEPEMPPLSEEIPVEMSQEALTDETAGQPGRAMAPPEGAAQTAPVEFSREEMIKDIIESIQDNEDILNFVKGLSRNTDENGAIYYTYTVGGVDKKLEDLDIDTLKDLSGRVSTEASRLNTENILEQLERIRETQRVTAGPPAAPQVPQVPRTPGTPGAYVPSVPPAPPSVPGSPPQPPRVPSGPPKR